MAEPQRVFFDLDGTLTDPYVGIRRSIEHALRALGIEAQHDDYRWCIGPPLLDSLRSLVGESLAADALRLYRERYADIGWQENTPYPGIRQALATLVSDGHSLFVATSKPHVFATRILSHFDLERFFLGIHGAELDGTRGDKTSLLAHALREESTDSAWMIGDRRHDVEGALANDMRAVGVSYGFGSVEELEEAGAERILASPGEIASLFDGNAA